MPTFREMVEEARGVLHQYTTNRPVLATFTGWQVTDSAITGVNLAGLSGQQKVVNAMVELGHELVYVSAHDPVAGTTLCPPWFRQQQGSPANTDYPANSVAVINPQWPYHQVAKHVATGIAQMYPSLFQVKGTTFETETLTERYQLPSDVEEIIFIKHEDDRHPALPQREVGRWTLETKAVDGNRYLFMEMVPIAGQNVYVTYKAAPTIPAITSNADWSTTGLPATAADLPVLWAVAQMLPSAEASKTQTSSVEQSERNRFVQGGQANAASRRFQELFVARLSEEKRKLWDKYPPRLHRAMNG